MAIVRAVKSGNWSDTTVWNTGALPTSADDVYSNTFTVTIDTSPTVLRISNATTTGVTVGGGFQITSGGINLTCTGAGVVNGDSNAVCLTITNTPGQANTLSAAIPSINSNQYPAVVRFSGTGTFNIVGNIFAGSSNGVNAGLEISSTGTVNVTGNVTGGGSASPGVRILADCTLNVTGDVTGSNNNVSTNTPAGISSGTTNATISVTGALTPGAGPACAAIAATGAISLSHVGTVNGANNVNAITSSSFQASVFLTGPLLTSSNGTSPIYVRRWAWHSSAPSSRLEVRTSNLASLRPLYTADSVGGNPATSNVRSGTVYGPANELTGTCAVPAAGSVALGVAVDNTTGTAILTAANLQTALTSQGLTTTRAANLDNLDATVSSRSTYSGADTSGTTTLLSRLTATRAGYLDNLDASVSSRLASSGYTTPPTVTQVRQELDSNSTKLANLDATVSSRLAGASYSAPLDAAGTRSAVGLATGNLDTQLSGISSGISGLPSASSIASAVWAAATRTLTTAIDNSSTIAAAVWAYASGRTVTGGTVDTLTNAPSVPSAATIASQVRTELSTELSRLDATVSSRLAPAGTLARVTLVDTTTTVTNSSPVDAGEIADAVRTELAPELAHLDADVSSRQPELARLSNVATTQEVGDIVEGALGD